MTVGGRAFGIHVNKPTSGAALRTPFHPLGYQSFRNNGNGFTWKLIETSKGTFGTTFPEAVTRARGAGCDILFTAGHPPAWATGGEVGGSGGVAHNNLPPDNISDWTDFLEYLDDTFELEAVEVWNEPNNASFWSGTKAQLGELHVAAYDLLHARGRKIVSASPSDGGSSIGSGTAYLFDYLTAEVIAKTDAVGYHNYVHPLPPEQIIVGLRHLRAVLRRLGAGHLPIWNTEFTWPNYYLEGSLVTDTVMPDALASAYIARSLIANVIGGAERCYFYGLDYEWSKIRLLDLTAPETLYDPADAYKFVAGFLTGSGLSRFRQVPPLYSVDWRKGGSRGRIYWCDDDETKAVDLSGYSSGVDVLGDPITLSASYSVTHSPVFLTT